MSTAKVDDIYDWQGNYRKQQVVQVVNVTDGALATGTTTVPQDDTIMQNTEGDQYMSLAITPKNVVNILKIDVVCGVVGSTATNPIMILGLFQDAVADALAVVYFDLQSAAKTGSGVLTFYMVAGTTSATTFKVRLGCNNTGTTSFNGVSGSRNQGGVSASSITITEYQPS